MKIKIKRTLLTRWSKKDHGLGAGILVTEEAIYNVSRAESQSTMFAAQLHHDNEEFLRKNIEVKMERLCSPARNAKRNPRSAAR